MRTRRHMCQVTTATKLGGAVCRQQRRAGTLGWTMTAYARGDVWQAVQDLNPRDTSIRGAQHIPSLTVYSAICPGVPKKVVQIASHAS